METKQENPRWILHCDCNSFFASVELLEHPELKHLPVAVCGDPDGRHGIILAKNEPAKKYGIQTAEVIWQAKQKCPDLVLLPSHREKYQHYYQVINAIYQQYTTRVEPFSVDESWLDVTNTWHLYAESPKALGDQIRNRVHAETGLTISVGVSFNKVFAKMGSDYKKPDATTLISRENYKDIVWPMPVGAMLFVGRRLAEKLASMHLRTIGDLAAADPLYLVQVLGKSGAELSRNARGEDNAPVRRWGESEPIKSVGNSTTYKRDLKGPADLRAGIAALADEVAGRLRRHGLYAGTVQITIKDNQLKSIQRQKQLPTSTHLAKDLEAAAWELLQKNWELSRPVRLLGVTALSLTDTPLAVQQSFFAEDTPKPSPKREALEKSLDQIRGKYGKHAIAGAYVLNNEIGLASLSMAESDAERELNDDGSGRQVTKGPLGKK